MKSKGFRAWLLAQAGRGVEVGDLAADLSRDSSFRGWSVSTIRAHLEANGACGGAIDALERASEEFLRIKRGQGDACG